MTSKTIFGTPEEEWRNGYALAVEHALTKVGQLSADRRGKVTRQAVLEVLNELKK